MENVKPGTVVTVWCNLDLITNPIAPIPNFTGARLMAVGGTGEQWWCWKAKRWAKGIEGNLNARWRRLQKKRRSAH